MGCVINTCIYNVPIYNVGPPLTQIIIILGYIPTTKMTQAFSLLQEFIVNRFLIHNAMSS